MDCTISNDNVGLPKGTNRQSESEFISVCVTSHHSRHSCYYIITAGSVLLAQLILRSFTVNTTVDPKLCYIVSQIGTENLLDVFSFFMVFCSLFFSRLTSSVQEFSLSVKLFGRSERLGRPFLIRFLAMPSVVRTDIERNVSCKRSQFIP